MKLRFSPRINYPRSVKQFLQIFCNYLILFPDLEHFNLLPILRRRRCYIVVNESRSRRDSNSEFCRSLEDEKHQKEREGEKKRVTRCIYLSRGKGTEEKKQKKKGKKEKK